MIEALLTTTTLSTRSVNAAPRVRLLLVLVVACAVVFSEQWLPLFGYTVLAVHFWQKSPVKIKAGLKRLAAVDGVILLTVVLLPFTEPGETAFVFAGLEISQAGLILAAMILLKANIILMTVMSLCAGLNALTLSQALAELKMPHQLVLMMQLSIRYISVMQQEFARLRCAMKARGFQPNSSLHTWRSYGYLFGMMLVRAMERADRIWLAMKCRGFNGRFPTAGTVPLTASDRWYFVGYFIVISIIFNITMIVHWFAITMTTLGVI
ncbi:cobalt ECF transporter T component CbiQ [Photobacterium nomapromontoriensis]|uniref:cobalt ECF transporter T component CbiQ n=1 Tax=Photobacterium nomapromontoriensis TaxID=2910237 RepID=UPI003D0D6485